MARILATAAAALLVMSSRSDAEDWAASVPLPEGEVATALFNGSDLSGWSGNTALFSAKDGAIRGANEERVPTSTYLFTEKSYRDFRLLLEVKQTMSKRHSTMHSAVACLGERFDDGKNAFNFRGPLLMFCHDWGIWDAYGRNRVYPPGQRGPIQRPKWEKLGEWNQIEILARGNRIRLVSNGQLVVDHTDDPERLKASPIGLQIHSNNQPQEFFFRGLRLVESPTDSLLTLSE